MAALMKYATYEIMDMPSSRDGLHRIHALRFRKDNHDTYKKSRLVMTGLHT